MNILEFAAQRDVELWPAQVVLLKLLYGIPLNDLGAHSFRLRWENEDTHRYMNVSFSEQEYIGWLTSQGWLTAPSTFRKALFILGRRTGKDVMLGLIAAYESSMGPPRTGWGRAPKSEILYLAPNRNLLQMARETYGLFKPISPSRPVEFRPLPRETRGRNPDLVLVNECRSHDEEFLHDSLRLDTRSLIVASAFNKTEGRFWKDYIDAHSSEEQKLMVVQIPTWEVVPGDVLPSQTLHHTETRNPATFGYEFGARLGPPLSKPRDADLEHCSR